MTETKYLVGIDFGTLSGRAVVVRADTGAMVGTAVVDYPYGVMDERLTSADNQVLPPEFALQNPADYILVLRQAVPEAIKDAGIDPYDVVGIGVDCTSATVLATDKHAVPLCQKPQFVNNPHAWVKLWKHHGAQDQADRLVAAAKERGEEWLSRYGGVMSSELTLPKVLETFEKAREVYDAADYFVNLLDWLTWKLTGRLTFAAGDSGYKRNYQDGSYPSPEYLEAVSPGFGTMFQDKMDAPILPLGAKVGGLTSTAAALLGLSEGIAVASGNIDAHVVVAGANAVNPGQLTAIMGTSNCYVVNSPELHEVPGTFGVVWGGGVDGAWGYESGQTAVGDIFAWFLDNCVPSKYEKMAETAGKTVHEILEELAAKQTIGAHGLIALDWHNGNRSILADSRLSGTILGLTLTTKAEDIYRALLESTCFGARVIIENLEKHGVAVDEIVAAGGLLKNQMYMQMLADITRKPITISLAPQTGALGAAVFAAVAAGIYPTAKEAAAAMAQVQHHAYTPNLEAARLYDVLFGFYQELHDHFGRGESEIMPQLKAFQAQQKAGNS
ncbi:ribulokinase [Mobiluncus mulieris]|uniref:Ribulokinase n=1 Tax=Mobiluncus mulieris TaxID=2052 RepID=A0A7Y0Y554_9ACTO|nr:ribulokinase [Mobiluncus mulieris]NMW65674.1 ribulokinase [Mobiluncus mulieris]